MVVKLGSQMGRVLLSEQAGILDSWRLVYSKPIALADSLNGGGNRFDSAAMKSN